MTWNERHAHLRPQPADPWLTSLGPLLGSTLPGPVLDVACGQGRNALWVAGLQGVDAPSIVGVDASEVAVSRARAEGARLRLRVRFEVRDVSSQGLPQGDWGAILVCHFLDRSLFPTLQSALAPGGLLAYKTHLRHPLRGAAARPRRPAFLLDSGELLSAFPALRILEYRESAAPGHALSTLLARRPATQSR